MTAVYPHAKVLFLFLFNSVTGGEKVCVHSATKLLWGKPAVIAAAVVLEMVDLALASSIILEAARSSKQAYTIVQNVDENLLQP